MTPTATTATAASQQLSQPGRSQGGSRTGIKYPVRESLTLIYIYIHTNSYIKLASPLIINKTIYIYIYIYKKTNNIYIYIYIYIHTFAHIDWIVNIIRSTRHIGTYWIINIISNQHVGVYWIANLVCIVFLCSGNTAF